MQKRRRQSFFLSLLILGIGLPGLVGIFVVQAQVAGNQPEIINAVFQSGSTSTPSSIQTDTALPSSTSTGSVFGDTSSPFGLTGVDIFAFIQAPNGYVERPFVVLTAFASIARSETVVIRGFIDNQEIICTESPCSIYLNGSARIIFRAFTSTGESSEEVISSVSVTSDSQGYLVTIDSVSQFESFVDSCALSWGIKDEENARWDSFVQFPYQINTKKTLHNLVTNLILNGIVDTSSCPTGGLSVGLDWPTACGLEVATPAMIEWQNQFDEYIWLAGKEHGIPPKILKTLIEVESQFWPGNSRFYLDEFGLGQINELGVDVLLRDDPSLYQEVCPAVLSDCSLPYVSLDTTKQAQIRGALVRSVDATCPTCLYGLDLEVAKDSISLVARLLRSNCNKVGDILGDRIDEADYEDLWRFSLSSYHSGISCFIDALNKTDKSADLTWENVSPNVNCGKGADYVDGVMNNLFAFDFYLYQAVDANASLAQPTIVPTRTPVSTPTVFISSATVKVQAYVDRNNNGTPEDSEWIDGMTVLLTTSDNDEITKRTENGVAIFDMTGFRPNLMITVSLPGLYRSENFVLPQTGEVPVIFRFDQPTLPTSLP